MSCLAATEVLLVDCQSTGANPQRGALLELGWAVARADGGGAPRQAASRLITLPAGERIPPRVSQLTGVRHSDLVGAVAPADAWAQLRATAAPLERADTPPVAVIHFARFETPFLRQLNGLEELPFTIICTHEIARRLLPALPRRGLRALAGYFGATVTQLRRSAEHVEATGVVWHHLVGRLAADHGIERLEQLHAWLAEPWQRGAGGRVYPMDRSLRLALPNAPGIYRMLRHNGDLLYIGKATSLKKRVNSYFQQQRRVPERTLEMLTQARDLSVTVTASALEAALLEADEIKRCVPPYNVALRTGDRQLWFCAVDFGSVAVRPSPAHPIGPLPAAESVAPLWEIGAAVSGHRLDAARRGVVLGVPAARAPDEDCFAAGLQLFVAAHPEGATPRQLLRLGRRLWRLRREAAAAAEDFALEPEASSERDQPTWDPQRVEAAICGSVSRAAHAVRRARWLCRLCEATLVFAEDRAREHVIAIAGGRVAAIDRAAVPVGARRRMGERQRAFDVGTYDRLRVLTTELRRLVVSGCSVELWLGERNRLGADALARALAWV